MRRQMLGMAMVAICAVMVGGWAWAQPTAPTVLSPHEGDKVGTRVELSIQTSPDALQMIWTEVVRSDTGETIKMVPGIRHMSNADGSYSGAIAAPRIYIGEDVPLIYEIHFRNGHNEGDPETVVNCYPNEGPGALPASPSPGGSAPPEVYAPRAGDMVGTRTEVSIKSTPGVIQVIWTEVRREDTGAAVRMVPGIRHATNEDGTYHGAIATPRISIGVPVTLRYDIHFRNGPNDGDPETVVSVKPAD